ncbi:hypothetical protein AVEN_92321-1 [Araneus ventricosus]|uniref:Uncharacterized protein n=1 Tax=Araneus ventricosus TaxID=182803 RepID=A0A4Y2AMH9_ARAVE|nr:hypothetical protein AVEN_92321-1 [Araneus ventricosus]
MPFITFCLIICKLRRQSLTEVWRKSLIHHLTHREHIRDLYREPQEEPNRESAIIPIRRYANRPIDPFRLMSRLSFFLQVVAFPLMMRPDRLFRLRDVDLHTIRSAPAAP